MLISLDNVSGAHICPRKVEAVATNELGLPVFHFVLGLEKILCVAFRQDREAS